MNPRRRSKTRGLSLFLLVAKYIVSVERVRGRRRVEILCRKLYSAGGGVFLTFIICGGKLGDTTVVQIVNMT